MRKPVFLSLLALSVSLPGCLSTNPSSGAIAVIPDTVVVAAGTSQNFLALPSGSLASIDIKWSVSGAGCSATSCGTIDPTGHYIAPAAAPANTAVQIIASDLSDPSKFGIANVTIGPPVAIVITQPPAVPVPVVASTQSLSSIAAKVSNSSNTTVNWTVTGSGCSGAACGTVSPASTPDATSTTTYTAPAPLPIPPTVSIVATSAADPTKSASLAVNLSLLVQVSPGSQTVGLLDTQQFQANVTGQENAPPVTVVWTLSNTGTNCSLATNPCGTITATGLYQAPAALPAPPAVTVTAAVSQVVNATTTLTGSSTATVDLTNSSSGANSQLFDHYAFLYRGYRVPTNPGPVNPIVEAGSLIFDGNGKIVLGSVEDDNDGTAPHLQQAVTGAYAFDATDNTRGTITLSGGLVTNFRFVLVPNPTSTVATTIFLTDFSGISAGEGRMQLQDKTLFSNPVPPGGYAVQLRGKSVPSAVGRFDVQGGGLSVANGEVGRLFPDSNFGDCLNSASTISIPVFSTFFTGAISVANSSGNARFSLQNFVVNGGAAQTPTFSAYLVSANKFFLLETDTNGADFAGSAELQTKSNFANSDFSGFYSHFLQSNNGSGAGNSDIVGTLSPGTNSLGTIAGLQGEWGGNLDGTFNDFGDDFDASLPAAPGGFYSVQTNGLALANSCLLGEVSPHYVMYFISPARAFVWNPDDFNLAAASPPNFAADGIGEMDQQGQQGVAVTGFGGSTVTYAVSFEGVEGNFAADGHTASNAISASGVVQFDYNGAGTVRFILDVSKGASNTGTTPVTITGTYTFSCSIVDEGCNLPEDTFWNFGLITYAGTPAFTLPNHFFFVSTNEVIFNFSNFLANANVGPWPTNIGGVAIKNQ